MEEPAVFGLILIFLLISLFGGGQGKSRSNHVRSGRLKPYEPPKFPKPYKPHVFPKPYNPYTDPMSILNPMNINNPNNINNPMNPNNINNPMNPCSPNYIWRKR